MPSDRWSRTKSTNTTSSCRRRPICSGEVIGFAWRLLASIFRQACSEQQTSNISRIISAAANRFCIEFITTRCAPHTCCCRLFRPQVRSRPPRASKFSRAGPGGRGGAREIVAAPERKWFLPAYVARSGNGPTYGCLQSIADRKQKQMEPILNVTPDAFGQEQREKERGKSQNDKIPNARR